MMFAFMVTLSWPISPSLSSILSITPLWSLAVCLNINVLTVFIVHSHLLACGRYHLSTLVEVYPLLVLLPRVVSISLPSCSLRSSTSWTPSITSLSTLAPPFEYDRGSALTTSSVGSLTQLKSPPTIVSTFRCFLSTLEKKSILAPPAVGAYTFATSIRFPHQSNLCSMRPGSTCTIALCVIALSIDAVSTPPLRDSCAACEPARPCPILSVIPIPFAILTYASVLSGRRLCSCTHSTASPCDLCHLMSALSIFHSVPDSSSSLSDSNPRAFKVIREMLGITPHLPIPPPSTCGGLPSGVRWPCASPHPPGRRCSGFRPSCCALNAPPGPPAGAPHSGGRTLVSGLVSALVS